MSMEQVFTPVIFFLSFNLFFSSFSVMPVRPILVNFPRAKPNPLVKGIYYRIEKMPFGLLTNRLSNGDMGSLIVFEYFEKNR